MMKKTIDRGNDSEFRNILLELRQKSRKYTRLNDALDCILSFDGRFPADLGRKSLTALQQAIVEVMGSKTGLVFSDDPVDPARIAFGVTEYGRIILSRDSAMEDGDLAFGCVTVTDEEWEKIIDLKSRRDDEAEQAS